MQDVVAFIPLRQPVKAPAIFRRRFITKEGLHYRDEEFRVVAPVVYLAFQQRFWRVGGKVGLQIGLLLAWQRHVTWQALRQQPQVRQPLNIGVTAQGVNAAACHPHIAEQQLDHRHRTNVLRTNGVLRPAEGIQERGSFIVSTGFCDVFADFQERVFWRTTDVFNHIWRVAGNVLFQQVPHAARMLQRGIAFGEAVFVQFISPGGFIVLAFFRVVAGEQAIFKAVILTHDQAGVGIGFGVFAVEFFIVQQVQQYA